MTAKYVCPAKSNSTRKTMAEGPEKLFTMILNTRLLPAQQNFTGANTTKNSTTEFYRRKYHKKFQQRNFTGANTTTNFNNRVLPAQIPQIFEQQNCTGANTTKKLNNRILPAQIPRASSCYVNLCVCVRERERESE